MGRRWRAWVEWPLAAFVSVVAALQSWGLVTRMLAYAQGALSRDLVYGAAVALFAGTACMTGPLIVAALRRGLTPGRAWRAVATAVGTALGCQVLPGLVSMADSRYRLTHDFEPPQGGVIPLLESLTIPLILLAPLLAFGAGVLVLLPAPPGSARRRIVTLLLVGVPVSLVAGVAMFVAAIAVLSTGEPWSGFNHSVVAGMWAVATVLLLVLDRHARALTSRPPGGAGERGVIAAVEPDDH